jgi:hypothetical protein
MSNTLIQALVQAPFVLVMAFLVHRFLTHLNARDLEWRAFTNEMHEALGERIEKLTESVEHLTSILITHDAATRGEAIRRAGPEDTPVIRRVR